MTDQEAREFVKNLVAKHLSEDYLFESLQNPTKEFREEIQEDYPGFQFTESELTEIFGLACGKRLIKYGY